MLWLPSRLPVLAYPASGTLQQYFGTRRLHVGAPGRTRQGAPRALSETEQAPPRIYLAAVNTAYIHTGRVVFLFFIQALNFTTCLETILVSLCWGDQVPAP